MIKILRFLICSLFTLALLACVEKEPSGPEAQEFIYTFKVNSDDTKTAFSPDHIKWQDGDLVASFASSSKNQTAAVSVGSDVTVKVRSSVPLSAGDVVYAYYPYNSENDATEASAVTLQIPVVQDYSNANAMPMVSKPFTLTGGIAAGTDTEVGTLKFINLGSVIKMNIFSSDASIQGAIINKVSFLTGVPCAGSFKYDLTSVNPSEPAAISGYEATEVSVLGNGSDPVAVGTSASDGAVFYLVVAPGTYSGSFVVSTNKGDFTYVSSKQRTYSRSGLKPFDVDIAGPNWTVVTDGYDTSIDSPAELKAFLEGTSAEDTASYTITADLDMSGISITSASGFGGTLDGGSHTISNLISSVPMFAQNSGSISNITLDETCAFTPAQTVTEFGALVALDNGGTYENVNTAASITITATENITNNIALGGLVGASNNADGSTFTTCSNSGAITINAAEYTHWAVAMAGIVGWTRKSTFDYCTNNGPVSLYAQCGDGYSHQWSFISEETTDTDGNISVAGIAGRALDHEQTKDVMSSYNHCENLAAGAITLNHGHMDALPKVDKTGCLNVAGICGQSNGSLEKCVNYAPITAIAICPANNDYWERRNCLLKVGGVAGLTWEGLAINSCSNRGSIFVNYDGSWEKTQRNMSAVGGVIGKQGYGLSNAKVTFSTNHGPITVTGNGHVAVGGITGSSGAMRGNRVYDTAPINVSCKAGFVGGLLGFADGSSQYQYIRTSYCEADITAENIWDTNRYKVCVGGLIGYFATGATGSYPSLIPYSNDTQRCHYTGNIVSTGQMKVGMVIGQIGGNNEKVFGTAETPILVTGTIHRWGYDADNAMSETLMINSSNVEEYAIGSMAGTVTIYVESSSSALNLMSFNIRGSSTWSARKSGIVEMFKDQSPDIIGIQEVDNIEPWEYLTSQLSDYSGFRPGIKTNAILYKTSSVELSKTGYFYLGTDYSASGAANSWDNYERTAVYATVRDIATGNYYFYVNTHFPLNQTGQTNSATLLESRIGELNTNNYPVILVGDFNCVYGNSCWDNIKTWMYNTRYAPGVSVYSAENQNLYTYNAFGDSSSDRNKIDHIWVSKSITVASYLTLTQEIKKYGDQEYLSDHYPIIAVIA